MNDYDWRQHESYFNEDLPQFKRDIHADRYGIPGIIPNRYMVFEAEHEGTMTHCAGTREVASSGSENFSKEIFGQEGPAFAL